MRKERIAFIHYPHWPNLARLETMPFALNALKVLVEAGWHIDLYLWGEEPDCYQKMFPSNIVVKDFRKPLYTLKGLWDKIQLQWQKRRYFCVFGVGQIGAYIAGRMAQHSRSPFIYFNDEFPSHWAKSRWTTLEKQAAQHATMIVVPGEGRFSHLCQELGISNSTPHVVLPNIPIISQTIEKINWHEQFEIPRDFTPFLCAGSLSDHTQIPELLSSIPYWPDKTLLILHTRAQEEVESYRKQLTHLDVPGRVIWSMKPLPESRLNSFVSYCAGNFALYRNIGENINSISFSSGKLMRSIACGSPVIVSKLPSLEFIEEYGLGHLVKHPAEIPAAVESIIQNRAIYQKRCRQFCNTHVSFSEGWDTFCEQFRQATRIDLQQPK